MTSVMENTSDFLEGLLSKMLDPFILACGFGTGIIILVISYLLFFHNKEADFEAVYGKEALELLGQSETKKGKGGKKKDKKKQKTPDETEDERERSPVQSSPTPSTPSPTQEAKVQKESKAPPPKAKAASPKEVKTTPPAESKVSPPKPVKVSAPKQQAQQSSPPRDQEPNSSNELAYEKVQESHGESPINDKKKKVVDPKDVDQKKVLARLGAISDLEDGYIQFLNTTFQNGEHQKQNLLSEVKALKRKLQDGTTKIEKLTKEKTAAEQREKDEISNKTALSARVQQLQTQENQLNIHIQNFNNAQYLRDQEFSGRITQLETENNALKRDVKRFSTQNNTSRDQLIKEQAKWQKEKAELDAEIKKHEEEEAGIRKSLESMTAMVERAEKEIPAERKAMNDLKAENSELLEQIAELQEDLAASKSAVDNQAKLDGEREQSEAIALKEENQKLNGEKQLMLENHARLEELIKELNRDISEFHAYYSKDQQEVIIGELKQRDQSHVEELASVKEESQTKENQLLEQVKEMKQKLTEVKKALEEEKSRLVEIPKNEPEPVVEEVFELKKTHADLATAAPSTSAPDSADVERLTAENATLRNKNDELRQRNMTILEKIEAAPSQLVKDRKQVVSEVGKVSDKQFKAFNDDEAYSNWLSESISDVQSRLNATPSAAAPAACPAPKEAPKAQKQAPPAQQVQPQNEGECYKALQILSKQLEHIDKLVDKTEEKHREEIARLKAQLSR